MMKPGFFFVVVLGVLGLAGSAHGTVCDVGGAAPVLVLASPSAVVAVVSSVGNGVHVARGESAGSGWVWAGALSGGLSIAAGAIALSWAMEEDPGLSLAITPWIVPMDQGSVAAGAELRVLGF